MITLDGADLLAGVAGTTDTITFTIFGAEVNSPSTSVNPPNYKVLAQGQLQDVAGAIYTVPAAPKKALIKSVHLVNTSGGSIAGVKLYRGGTAAANQLTGSVTIAANGWAVLDADGWRFYDSDGGIKTTGSTGPQGSQGPLGPPGADGFDAEDGEPGPPGLIGATGATGAAGSAGATGSQGLTGPAVFLVGDTGEDGELGPPGLLGATGSVGATGATGATGSAGAQGQAGPAIYLVMDPDDPEPGPRGQPGVDAMTRGELTALVMGLAMV